MSGRKLIRKPDSFVPSVKEILPGSVEKVPNLEATISYWTEDAYPAKEWFCELNEHWGTAGFALWRGGEVQGFVIYGPQEYLPRARSYPFGALDEDAVLLAYVGGDTRTRRHLVVRMLRDLRSRNIGSVEAIASDLGLPKHIPTRFLLECGWKPVRQGWKRGMLYTLLRTDLGSTVEVGELARGLFGRVRLPALKPRGFVPGTLVQGKPAGKRFKEADSRP